MSGELEQLAGMLAEERDAVFATGTDAEGGFVRAFRYKDPFWDEEAESDGYLEFREDDAGHGLRVNFRANSIFDEFAAGYPSSGMDADSAADLVSAFFDGEIDSDELDCAPSWADAYAVGGYYFSEKPEVYELRDWRWQWKDDILTALDGPHYRAEWFGESLAADILDEMANKSVEAGYPDLESGSEEWKSAFNDEWKSIFVIRAIRKTSRLYHMLWEYFSSPQFIEFCTRKQLEYKGDDPAGYARCAVETDEYLFYMSGANYNTVDKDLLYGDGSGAASNMFDAYVDERADQEMRQFVNATRNLQ